MCVPQLLAGLLPHPRWPVIHFVRTASAPNFLLFSICRYLSTIHSFSSSIFPPTGATSDTMLLDALTLSFALHILLGADSARALPSSPSSPSSSSRSLHIPLLRRAAPHRNETQFALW